MTYFDKTGIFSHVNCGEGRLIFLSFLQKRARISKKDKRICKNPLHRYYSSQAQRRTLTAVHNKIRLKLRFSNAALIIISFK